MSSTEDEPGGMTDLQFKAYLRSLKADLETIAGEKDEQALRDGLARLIATLQSSIEG